MSLATNRNSNKSKAPESRSYRMFAAIGRWCIQFSEAIADARMHHAMLEVELYLNRYKHCSKSDDDLPMRGGSHALRRRHQE